MKKNIAIVWGGYSSEIIVSEKSMQGIYSWIDKNVYNVYKVRIDKTSWTSDIDGKIYNVDKNDFSITLDASSIKIDFAYITIHGTPGEDGHLQGYLDMLNIPYSSCGMMASALTFNKFVCNKYLKNFEFNIAESIYLREGSSYSTDDIVNKLGLPIFVKPNTGGSSFATTKVKSRDQLENAIGESFRESSDAIIESFIQGREITCGCYKTSEREVLLPLTEVVTQNEFFDYNAKYLGEVEEITPAKISQKLTSSIQSMTSQIYDLVGAKGLIRVDFIISENTPYLLEVNTTPGMTLTSFIPQQVEAANMKMADVLSEIIENEYKKLKK